MEVPLSPQFSKRSRSVTRLLDRWILFLKRGILSEWFLLNRPLFSLHPSSRPPFQHQLEIPFGRTLAARNELCKTLADLWKHPGPHQFNKSSSIDISEPVRWLKNSVSIGVLCLHGFPWRYSDYVGFQFLSSEYGWWEKETIKAGCPKEDLQLSRFTNFLFTFYRQLSFWSTNKRKRIWALNNIKEPLYKIIRRKKIWGEQ